MTDILTGELSGQSLGPGLRYYVGGKAGEGVAEPVVRAQGLKERARFR